MEAIDRISLAALAGAVLGLALGAVLARAGILNPTAVAVSIISLGLIVWLLVPTTPSGSTNLSPLSPGQRAMPHTRDGNDARLDDWVGERASRGGSLIPTVELEAEASHALGSKVGQGPLRDAIDRYRCRVQVEAFHRMRRTLVRP